MSSVLVKSLVGAPAYAVDVRAGASFELLIALSARPERAGPAIGDPTGETWLHLLGLALEAPRLDAAGFAAYVERVPAAELRRTLVGVHVPTWRGLVGAATLDRAARGDARAVAALLAHDRYYAGRAREALSTLLPLTPRETKRRIVEALFAFATTWDGSVVERLERAAATARARLASAAPGEAVSAVTAGYEYEPEPEFSRVVLVPHAAAAPLLLLCQHRDARLICYPAPPETGDLDARALALGRALGDERRIRILRRLAAGEASLAELARVGGVGKPTAHHHLAQLRAAGLVVLRGNARGYTYALRREASSEARETLDSLLA